MQGSTEDVLGGRYRLLELLGTGGMAEVWRAHDGVLGRDVAVKLLAAGSMDALSRDRIRAEAKAVAQLSHPNIAGVFDYGESDGEPYVVMELVPGQTLSARLREVQRLQWRDAVAVAAEVATALAAAHARGLVHRDIKPANIMLTPAGVKVVDFGIAGLVGSPDEVAVAGEVVGTPAYLAPERLLGGPVRAASDVYAVGLLLYRCLTGGLPWDAETLTQMISSHCYEPPRPLPQIDGMPAAVTEIYAECLAKEPADRPPAAELARVLAAAAGIAVALTDDAPAAGPVLRVAAADDRPDAAGAAPSGGVADRWRLARAGAIVVAVVAALVLGGAALLDPAGPRRGATAATSAPECRVRFAAQAQGAETFVAGLVVTNTGTQARSSWALTFDVPDGVVLRTGTAGGLWRQDGAVVTFRSDGADLAPATPVRLGFTAAGPMPQRAPSFALDGAPCAAPAAGDDGDDGDGDGAPAPGDPADPDDPFFADPDGSHGAPVLVDPAVVPLPGELPPGTGGPVPGQPAPAPPGAPAPTGAGPAPTDGEPAPPTTDPPAASPPAASPPRGGPPTALPTSPRNRPPTPPGQTKRPTEPVETDPVAASDG